MLKFLRGLSCRAYVCVCVCECVCVCVYYCCMGLSYTCAADHGRSGCWARAAAFRCLGDSYGVLLSATTAAHLWCW